MNDNIDEVIKMLDDLTAGEVSRIKVETSGQVEEGKTKKTYHHGRCDVGSVWAKGKAFDVLEEANKGDCN